MVILQQKASSKLQAKLKYILGNGAGFHPKAQWLCGMMLIVNGADNEVGETEVASC